MAHLFWPVSFKIEPTERFLVSGMILGNAVKPYGDQDCRKYEDRLKSVIDERLANIVALAECSICTNPVASYVRNTYTEIKGILVAPSSNVQRATEKPLDAGLYPVTILLCLHGTS
jgi:hypothetical protein